MLRCSKVHDADWLSGDLNTMHLAFTCPLCSHPPHRLNTGMRLLSAQEEVRWLQKVMHSLPQQRLSR